MNLILCKLKKVKRHNYNYFIDLKIAIDRMCIRSVEDFETFTGKRPLQCVFLRGHLEE